MTIFQILQVFHASLCPLGHGGLYESSNKLLNYFHALLWVESGC